MRTVSRGRNRLVLIVCGALLLIAGAWVMSASTSLRQHWQGAERFLPAPQHTLVDIAAVNPWLLPVALIISVLLLGCGVLLLIGQVPTAPPSSPVRITDGQDSLLGSIEPKVFERALQETAESFPGIESSNVYFGGSTRAPWLQAEVTVAEGAHLAWAVNAVRAGLAEAVTTALGTPPARLDLQVKLGT
ncbi:hypothetical protein [Corynebacterium sp.]|uniref:hypothetical protein n=1 Tax=Corynebacterium sp. TaxID=1720 RepID=UPI0026DB0E22|nr:hypothetical protein [Corynebacterium sp.]MDO5077298.1 hypothetical protein [Corynebacterium sp.]